MFVKFCRLVWSPLQARPCSRPKRRTVALFPNFGFCKDPSLACWPADAGCDPNNKVSQIVVCETFRKAESTRGRCYCGNPGCETFHLVWILREMRNTDEICSPISIKSDPKQVNRWSGLARQFRRHLSITRQDHDTSQIQIKIAGLGTPCWISRKFREYRSNLCETFSVVIYWLRNFFSGSLLSQVGFLFLRNFLSVCETFFFSSENEESKKSFAAINFGGPNQLNV